MNRQYTYYLYTATDGNVCVKKLQNFDSDDTHILTNGRGYGYNLPLSDAEKWRLVGWSAGCYRQGIFIPADADINQYIPTINNEVATKLRSEISGLQKTLAAVETWTAT